MVYARDDRGRVLVAADVTNALGEFVLDVGVPGDRGDLMASPPRGDLSSTARFGVASDAQGIELRLGVALPITIEVRDQREELVRAAKVTARVLLAGHELSTEVFGDGPWYLPVPPAAFSVAAFGPRIQAVQLGPIEPFEAESPLVLHVRTPPTVGGRVTYGGQPVEDAYVAIASVEAEAPDALDVSERSLFWDGLGSTDADGRFQGSAAGSGPHVLRAFESSLGEGRLGPVVLDGSSDVEALDIALDRPAGNIAGRVLLPEGHLPGEVGLLVGDSYLDLRDDGSYTIGNLLPGRCRLQVVRRRSQQDAPVMRGSAPFWLGVDTFHYVEVVSGTTVRFDIDLTPGVRARLDGRVVLDGVAPQLRWGTWPLPEGARLHAAETVSIDDIDTDGGFAVGADIPGEYGLRCELALACSRRATWVITDHVRLVAGRTSWTLDVATGSLRVWPADEMRPLWHEEPEVRWTRGGDLLVRVLAPDLDETTGARFFPSVPAGRVQVVHYEPGGGLATLECVVRAGEPTEVRWPR